MNNSSANPNTKRSLLAQHNSYIQPHVGGNTASDYDQKYIDEQKRVISERNRQIPQSYSPRYEEYYTQMPGLFGTRYPNQVKQDITDRYDPYGDYLHRKNLLISNNVTRYTTHYLNINSADRRRVPASNKGTPVLITNNGMMLTKGETNLMITYQNHNMGVNDKLSISGLSPTKKTLNIKTTANILIEFENDSAYMAINYPHNIDYTTEADALTFDTSELFVGLEGIRGYNSTSMIGNIPINYLNGRHRIYIVHPDKIGQGTYSLNKFYIKLNRTYSDNGDTYAPTTYKFVLYYYYIGGISLNRINADYPVDLTQLQGFHIINSIVDDNRFTINLNKSAGATLSFGGDISLYISKIIDIDQGYPYPNTYSIQLEKTYTNIISARIISSEFPNTEKVFKGTTAKQNNKLYWQNIEDGDITYSIELSPGNYTPDDLITEIQNKAYEVLRTDKTELGGILATSSYSNRNFIRVSIDTNTDIVTFKSYKEAILRKPFIETNPIIDPTSTSTETAASYTITVEQVNHGLVVGDTILISGSLSYLGIPSDTLNLEHVVTEVVDTDRYRFAISHFNLLSSKEDNSGGNAITIYAPNLVRFRFDYSDTIGAPLGFRDVGEINAVTQYASVITNADAYFMESTFPVNPDGSTKVFINNNINLSGDNYIALVCKQLKGIQSTGKIKDMFAKILLSGLPGKVLYNTVVNTQIYEFNLIPELTQLDFEYYSPDGVLYDFNNIDHSFTLELITLDELPKGTGIVPSSGKIN